MIFNFQIPLWKVKLLLASIILLFATCLGQASAQNDIVEVRHTGFSKDLSPYIVYLIDADGTLDLQQALRALERGEFAPVQTPVIDFGFSDARFWLKTTISNNTDKAGVWKLSPEIALLESINIYVLPTESRAANTAEKIYSFTNKEPFSARQFPQRYLKTEVSLEAQESVDLIIEYTSDRATQLPLFLENADQYYERRHMNDIFKASAFGILIGIAVISTIYMAALGLNSALYYAAYLFCVGMYLFSNDGFGLQLVWPDNPEWNTVASAPFGIMGISFLTMFMRSYVTAFAIKPLFKIGFLIYACVGVVLAIGSQFQIESAAYKLTALTYTGIGGFIPLFGAVFALHSKQPGALAFLIGALFVGISFSLVSVGYFNPGLINHHVFGRFTLYAMIIEGFTFATAIFAHTQNVRRERAIALQRQFELSEEKLSLSEALRSAETGYRTAVELANNQRNALAATAHDIRQPLSSLRMALMRLNGRDPKRAEEIAESFNYLDNIVNQSLENATPIQDAYGDAPESTPASLANSAHHIVENDAFEVFAISAVLKNVKAMFAEEAEQRGLDLHIDDDDTLVRSRPVDLMRIVSNLVSNAIRNTQSGGVKICTSKTKTHLRVDVIDTGVGMHLQEQDRLKKAQQRSADYHGHGLGLSVVETLAHANQIQTKIKSKTNQGTTFSLFVPIAQ